MVIPPMRLLLAMFKHETNTFSPIVTDLARFEAWGARLEHRQDARLPHLPAQAVDGGAHGRGMSMPS